MNGSRTKKWVITIDAHEEISENNSGLPRKVGTKKGKHKYWKEG